MDLAASQRSYAPLVKKLRQGFFSQKTKPLEWRREQLQSLLRLLKECEAEVLRALHQDLGKSSFEGYTSEVGLLRAEIRYVLKNLSLWSQSQRVNTPIALQPAKSFITRQPLGLVLIVGPWNYPFQLVLAPLIGAIAAGNCALIKPSEVAPHCSGLLRKLVPRYLDHDCIAVVEGDATTTHALLQEKFDHIFFTGSPANGRVIMQAAAQHLTPVTLELGGKSPCVVDEDVDLALAAKRIAWGKFINAGQTCVAPDYVLVHEKMESAFMEHLRGAVHALYGENPLKSKDFGRIINEKHVRRLAGLLGDTQVFLGGNYDCEQRYFAPTILTGVTSKCRVMQEEIFGPILPVLSVKNLEDAIEFINHREKPLALYFFSKNRDRQNQILNSTTSGAVCINDTVSHVAVPELPFGGIGNSGMGAYHGESSFNTFSHRKAVYMKSNLVDISLRYPPYHRSKLDIARWFL